MAEVVEQQDLTPAGADRWQVWYRVRRNDGEEVFVEASCTRTAEEVARAQNDHEALAIIADRGEAAALKYAESAQSPADRGKVIVRLWVDGLNGSLHHDPDYERAL